MELDEKRLLEGGFSWETSWGKISYKFLSTIPFHLSPLHVFHMDLENVISIHAPHFLFVYTGLRPLSLRMVVL